MAHTKAAGSTRLGRDSASQRLGVKRFGGQMVKIGEIIVRQRGTRLAAGPGTAYGVDQTIFATRPGQVRFYTARIMRFSGRRFHRTHVAVDSE